MASRIVSAKCARRARNAADALEIERDVLRRLKALRWLFRVQPGDDVAQPVGQVRVQLADRPGRVLADALERRHGGGGAKRRTAGGAHLHDARLSL